MHPKLTVLWQESANHKGRPHENMEEPKCLTCWSAPEQSSFKEVCICLSPLLCLWICIGVCHCYSYTHVQSCIGWYKYLPLPSSERLGSAWVLQSCGCFHVSDKRNFCTFIVLYEYYLYSNMLHKLIKFH